MIKLTGIFLFLLAVSGCPKQMERSAPGNKDTNVEAPSEQEAVPFPVYLTFEEFEHHLQKQNDTTYVVNFWATWCKPCVAELPWFEQLIPAYQNRPVEVLLVSMDFPKQIKNKLIPFVKERQLEEAVVALADMDYNSWIDKVSEEWDGAIPFTLIYNQQERRIKLGELESYEELAAMVDEMLD